MPSKITFLQIIFETIKFNLNLINKKSNWLIDLVFEIYLDCKFWVCGEIFKKSTIIRNSINYFENLDQITSHSSF